MREADGTAEGVVLICVFGKHKEVVGTASCF